MPTWVETDRIQMDDFNDMTDKLDAAIAAVNQRIDQVNPVVKLKELLLTENQSQVNLDLSDVDWSPYTGARIWMECKTTSSSSTVEELRIRVNDATNYSNASNYLVTREFSSKIIFFGNFIFSPALICQGETIVTTNLQEFISGCSGSSFTKFTVTLRYGSVSAGTKIIAYGTRL